MKTGLIWCDLLIIAKYLCIRDQCVCICICDWKELTDGWQVFGHKPLLTIPDGRRAYMNLKHDLDEILFMMMMMMMMKLKQVCTQFGRNTSLWCKTCQHPQLRLSQCARAEAEKEIIPNYDVFGPFRISLGNKPLEDLEVILSYRSPLPPDLQWVM